MEELWEEPVSSPSMDNYMYPHPLPQHIEYKICPGGCISWARQILGTPLTCIFTVHPRLQIT